MKKKKILLVEKHSVWHADKAHFVGEIFDYEDNRYYPQTDKAQRFAESQGVTHFVFMEGSLVTEDVK